MKMYFFLSVLLLLCTLTYGQTKHTVQMRDNRFVPNELTIKVGDIVEWVNSGTMVHTATSGANCQAGEGFNSGNLNPTQTFSFTFTKPGEVAYFCIPHCSVMTGTISVQTVTSATEEIGESFAIFPNPATDQVTLYMGLPVAKEVSCTAYDLTGKQMYATQNLKRIGTDGQTLQLDVRQWVSGIYVLRIAIEGEFASMYKLVRQ